MYANYCYYMLLQSWVIRLQKFQLKKEYGSVQSPSAMIYSYTTGVINPG